MKKPVTSSIFGNEVTWYSHPKPDVIHSYDSISNINSKELKESIKSMPFKKVFNH